MKKSFKVKKIRVDQVVVETNGWIKRKKNVSLNFSADSYLSLLADIEKSIKNSTKERGFWSRIMNLIGLRSIKK